MKRPSERSCTTCDSRGHDNTCEIKAKIPSVILAAPTPPKRRALQHCRPRLPPVRRAHAANQGCAHTIVARQVNTPPTRPRPHSEAYTDLERSILVSKSTRDAVRSRGGKRHGFPVTRFSRCYPRFFFTRVGTRHGERDATKNRHRQRRARHGNAMDGPTAGAQGTRHGLGDFPRKRQPPGKRRETMCWTFFENVFENVRPGNSADQKLFLCSPLNLNLNP